MPSDQSRIIQHAKFTYSPLRKAFEKHIKTIEDQGIKQVEALKALKPEENNKPESIEGVFANKMRTNEIKGEIYWIKQGEEKFKQENLKYRTKNCIYDFEQYETMRCFGESISTGKN